MSGALILSVLSVFSPTPAGGEAPWKIPVLVVKYYPLAPGGKKLDIQETSNVGSSIEVIRKKCGRLTKEIMEALDEGSRFRAYKNLKAAQSLDYRIAGEIEYLEAVPKSQKKYGSSWLPDYAAIMKRVKIREWVEEKGVKEVWIWGYHSKVLAPWESNMSSPFGDVSNSDRDPKDLPVLKKTYTVYHYNYQRGVSEAVENHLHQIEALMRRHGGSLWRTFEGKKGAWRCGNCHFPPNGRKDYDWANKEYVLSDIEDWKPEGFGKKERLNCDKWGGQSLNWFIYWMRSIPGHQSGLTFKGKPLTNWWVLVGDYDFARKHSMGLVSR